MVASASEKKLEGLKCAEYRPYQWLLSCPHVCWGPFFLFPSARRSEMKIRLSFSLTLRKPFAWRDAFHLGSTTHRPFVLFFFSPNFQPGFLSFFLFQGIRTKLALSFNLHAIAKSTTEMDRKPIWSGVIGAVEGRKTLSHETHTFEALGNGAIWMGGRNEFQVRRDWCGTCITSRMNSLNNKGGADWGVLVGIRVGLLCISDSFFCCWQ